MKRLLSLLRRGAHAVAAWFGASAAGISTDFIDLRSLADPNERPARRAETPGGRAAGRGAGQSP